MDKSRKICVGMITAPHGVRGLIKLRSFTEDPDAIRGYKPLTDEEGERTFDISIKNVAHDHFVASVKGVDSREAAESLQGVKLYIDRQTLPKTKKAEFYHGDLIGLRAEGTDGQGYGTVRDVHDHGAGVFLEIGKSRADSFMLPFRDVFVPTVDVTAGLVIVAPPEGWLKNDREEKDKTDDED